MIIKFAKFSDAPIIHDLMIKAFSEYKNAVPPSSALDETVQSITTDIKNGEQCIIGYLDNQPVGMVRFQLQEVGLYFFRLSVIPEKQGKGIAKKLLNFLEDYAKEKELPAILCKARENVPRNIYLYQSLGYEIIDEELLQKDNGIKYKIVTLFKRLN